MLSLFTSHPLDITDNLLKGLQILKHRLPGTVYSANLARKRKVTLFTLAVCTKHVEEDYLDAVCIELVQHGWTYNEDREYWVQFIYRCNQREESITSRHSLS